MWYADVVGLEYVLSRVKEFEDAHGANWKPAPLLEQLASEGRMFADLDNGQGRR